MSEKWVEVVVRSKRNAPFPCSPVIREWLQKKTEIEKRNKQKKANDFFCVRDLCLTRESMAMQICTKVTSKPKKNYIGKTGFYQKI